jgi:hypothetical protein
MSFLIQFKIQIWFKVSGSKYSNNSHNYLTINYFCISFQISTGASVTLAPKKIQGSALNQ